MNLLPVLLLSIRYSEIFYFWNFFFFFGGGGGGGGIKFKIISFKNAFIFLLKTRLSQNSWSVVVQVCKRTVDRLSNICLTTFRWHSLNLRSKPGPFIKKCLVYDEEKKAILHAPGLINIQNSERGKML